jgi:NADH-quinone oxidoreductase subunit M
LPGLANFAGEILVLLGTFQQHPLWALIALLGVVFAAAYMLRLVQGVLWGPAYKESSVPDLTLREWLILMPMAILVIWMGVYPEPFLAPMHGAVETLLAGGLP